MLLVPPKVNPLSLRNLSGPYYLYGSPGSYELAYESIGATRHTGHLKGFSHFVISSIASSINVIIVITRIFTSSVSVLKPYCW